MEFSELLIQEHKWIRRAVTVLKAMTDQVEQGAPVDKHDMNALLVFLHYFADACHQAKEESILFPALRQSEKYRSFAQTEALFKEHNEERALMEQAQLSIFTDNQPEFIASARRLTHLLAEHAIREEAVLFPLAEQILTSGQGAEVAMRIQEADAKFGSRQRKLLLDMLQVLEGKYLRKAA